MRQKALEYTRVVLRFAVVALAVGLPLMAQGPATNAISQAKLFSIYFANSAAVIALIWGFMQLAFGEGHRSGAFIGMLIGVGGMVYAQQIVVWLFP